jgi:hypothetical protein
MIQFPLQASNHVRRPLPARILGLVRSCRAMLSLLVMALADRPE